MKLKMLNLNYLLFLFCINGYLLGLKHDINNLKDKPNLIHFAILGSGPAGLSAAIPCSRTGLNTIVFQGPKPGGQIADSKLVENWPGVPKGSGSEVMDFIKDHSLSFGAHIEPDTITEVDFSSWPFKLVGQKTYYALSVIIATGSVPKSLNIEGSDKYWLKGIVSCGLCDANLAEGQHVAIIGNGENAVKRILQLMPYAKSMTVVTKNDVLCSSPELNKKITNLDNVEILYNKEVLRFSGDDKKLTSIDVIDKKSGEQYTIDTNWAFVSIGFEPNTKMFKDCLSLDAGNHIIHDTATQETEILGVYAAGNACDSKYKQAATASGDATKAAFNAVNFVRSMPIDKKLTKLITPNLYIPEEQKENNITSINGLNEFNKIINKKDLPVLIDFYSPLCGSCKALEPVITSISENFKNKIHIFKVDITKNSDLAKKAKITSVPTLLFYHDNKEIERHVGEITFNDLKKLVEKVTKQLSSKKRKTIDSLYKKFLLLN